MPLTSTQLRALRVLDWLFDLNGHRAQGRTSVLAVALIRQALRNPGHKIRYLDHYLGTSQDQLMPGKVEGYIYQDRVLSQFQWDFQRSCFRLMTFDIGMLPFDWLPDSEMDPEEARGTIAAFEERIEGIYRREAEFDEPKSESRSAWKRLAEDEGFQI